MSTKSKDYKKIEKLLKEDVEDTELQENYEGFKNNVERFQKELTSLDVEIERNNIRIDNLKHSILSNTAEGLNSDEMMEKLQELVGETNEMVDEFNDKRKRLHYNKGLIEKYEEKTHDKLFMYWKILKELNKDIEPFLEWKEQYKGEII